MTKRFLFYISENYSFQILRPLQQEILRRGDNVAWFVEGTNVDFSYFRTDEHCLTRVVDVVAYNPRVVFVPGNVVPSFIPGLKVCVRHGFMGFKVRKKDGLNYSLIIRDCFDLYCSLGPSMTKPLIELEKQHNSFKVVETGFCKMDPFYQASKISAKPKNHQPVILFSSTFSPRLSQAEALLSTIKRLSIDTKWRWLVTFHPKMDQQIVKHYKAAQHANLTFIETDDSLPLMLEADLMLGDNSSMLIEFMVLGKPVVTINNEFPQPHMINVTDASDIEDAIETALSYPSDLIAKIDEFASNTHPYKDGLSSARILDASEHAMTNLNKIKRKPFNLIRNLKLRKKLNYWAF